jgi:hypothetical protein
MTGVFGISRGNGVGDNAFRRPCHGLAKAGADLFY